MFSKNYMPIVLAMILGAWADVSFGAGESAGPAGAAVAEDGEVGKKPGASGKKPMSTRVVAAVIKAPSVIADRARKAAAAARSAMKFNSGYGTTVAPTSLEAEDPVATDARSSGQVAAITDVADMAASDAAPDAQAASSSSSAGMERFFEKFDAIYKNQSLTSDEKRKQIDALVDETFPGTQPLEVDAEKRDVEEAQIQRITEEAIAEGESVFVKEYFKDRLENSAEHFSESDFTDESLPKLNITNPINGNRITNRLKDKTEKTKKLLLIDHPKYGKTGLHLFVGEEAVKENLMRSATIKLLKETEIWMPTQEEFDNPTKIVPLNLLIDFNPENSVIGDKKDIPNNIKNPLFEAGLMDKIEQGDLKAALMFMLLFSKVKLKPTDRSLAETISKEEIESNPRYNKIKLYQKQNQILESYIPQYNEFVTKFVDGFNSESYTLMVDIYGLSEAVKKICAGTTERWFYAKSADIFYTILQKLENAI